VPMLHRLETNIITTPCREEVNMLTVKNNYYYLKAIGMFNINCKFSKGLEENREDLQKRNYPFG